MTTSGARAKGVARKASVLTRLLPYIFFVNIAPTLTIAVTFGLLRFFACRLYWEATDPSQVPVPDAPICRIRLIDARTSSIVACLSVLDSGISLISSSLLQRLADKWGRRPMLVGLALCGSASGLALLGAQWASSMPVILGLVLVYSVMASLAAKAGQYLSGLCIADTTDAEDRTPAFTQASAAAIGAMTTGFLTSSLVSKLPADTFVLPFLLSISLYGLCAVYAAILIPETKSAPTPTQEELVTSRRAANVFSTVLAPVYPLRLLWPAKKDGAGRDWNLCLLALASLVTGSISGFLPTAVILYLSTEFRFGEEQNGYVLAWFVGSRFLFLVLPFPVFLRAGRAWVHDWQVRHPVKQAIVVEAGEASDERTPLLPGVEASPSDTIVDVAVVSVVEEPSALANHFDVIVLVLSLWAESAGYLCLYFSHTWPQIAACFVLLALSSGFNSCIKSLFVAYVRQESASESLAALDLIQSAALVVSPILIGNIFSMFIKANRPSLLFLVSSGALMLVPIILAPIRHHR